jgi:hypothetical protein
MRNGSHHIMTSSDKSDHEIHGLRVESIKIGGGPVFQNGGAWLECGRQGGVIGEGDMEKMVEDWRGSRRDPSPVAGDIWKKGTVEITNISA